MSSYAIKFRKMYRNINCESVYLKKKPQQPGKSLFNEEKNIPHTYVINLVLLRNIKSKINIKVNTKIAVQVKKKTQSEFDIVGG